MSTTQQPDEKSLRPDNAFVRFRKEDIEQSLPSRFEQQVSRFPARLAVKTPHHQLTYHELNCFANRVAHALLSSRTQQVEEPVGAGHRRDGGQAVDLVEERVALLFEQGGPLITSILGILKAGKIYVPLDPADPPARLSLVVNESGAMIILTDSNNFALAQTLVGQGRVVINVDALDDHLPNTSPALDISADGYAYIFYTSGSTGKPKGVVDAHRNVLHNVMRYTNNLHISENDRLTLIQSASFSGSVSSLFCALLNGATVFPYDVHTQGIGSPLAAWLKKEEITIYHSVPAIFRSFLSGDVRFPLVRIIRLEGDAASRLDVELYKKHFSQQCLLVNGLGATETGISRQYFISHATQLGSGIVPVGYPTEDMDVIVVDADGKEVGRNTTGEIAVRSKYLAAGYWNNPELTAQAFTVAENGSRTYRTGDMGLMRDDGCLEYLGRKDFQVKIKGHRVEAAEVESALLAIDAVKEAVVTTRKDRTGEARLVAYIVARNASRPSAQFLRRSLAKKLPGYMLPTRYVVLDALPLNANLKVDRRLLPSPDTIARDGQTPFIPPRTKVEAALVEMWERTLDIRQIGVKDDFFDLGGDSLAAVQLLIQIEQRFHKELAPGTIVQCPTIEQLAHALRSGQSSACLVAMQPGGSKPALFCAPSHDGNVLQFTSLAGHLGSDRPFYGLQPVGMSGDEEPLTSIESMASRYNSEVRTVQPQGPYYLGGFCFGGVIALEMAHQLAAAGEEVALLALFDMNPGELPAVVTKKALGEYRRYQAKRAGEHRRERLRRERFRYVMEGINRVVSRNVKRIAWQVARRWKRALPRILWDVGLGNDHAFQTYTPRPLRGRVTLFLAENTTRAYTDDPHRTWENLANGEVEAFLVPGEEGGMLKEPHVGVLAKKLRLCLERPSG